MSDGLHGKVISFHIVPLDPAYKAELAGHVPAKQLGKTFDITSFPLPPSSPSNKAG